MEIHDAVRDGKVVLVEDLIRKGANVNARDENLSTPLHVAAECGDVGMCKLLLRHGADPNAKDAISWTPLMWARSRHFEDVLNLLEKLSDNNRAKESALKKSIENLDVEGVKKALADGADVNEKFPYDYDWRPLHWVIFAGLIPRKDDRRERQLEILNVLLEAGAEVDAKDSTGVTPFAMCSAVDYKPVYERLVQAGADVNSKDFNGCTPLHDAAYAGEDSYIEFLISHGARVNETDNQGRTPLHYAADCSQVWVLDGNNPVKVLLRHGAEVNAKDKWGFTPLHLGWFSEALVEAGADINAVNDDGNTPLHEAAFHGSPNAVKLLIEHGADTTIENAAGQTAYTIAKAEWRKDEKLLKLFEKSS